MGTFGEYYPAGSNPTIIFAQRKQAEENHKAMKKAVDSNDMEAVARLNLPGDGFQEYFNSVFLSFRLYGTAKEARKEAAARQDAFSYGRFLLFRRRCRNCLRKSGVNYSRPLHCLPIVPERVSLLLFQALLPHTIPDLQGSVLEVFGRDRQAQVEGVSEVDGRGRRIAADAVFAPLDVTAIRQPRVFRTIETAPRLAFSGWPRRASTRQCR